MELDVTLLRKHYATLPDAKLRSLIEESLDLTPDAVQVLKEEIAKRGLPLLRSVNNVFENKVQIDKLIEERIAIIRDRTCPICKTEEYKLNGICLSTVSFFKSSKAFYIACPNCLMNKKHEATNKTSFINIGLYWGVIRAHQSLTLNMKAAEELNSGNPTKCLWEYASELVHDEYRRTMSDINVHPPISHHQGK